MSGAQSGSDDLNDNGVPDECELDCNSNGVPDEVDLSFGTSSDCNSNLIPDECEPDCNANGVTDACDLSGARVCLEGLETPLREARDVHLASRAMEGDSSRSPMPAEGRIEALKGRLHKAEANRKSMLVQVFRTVDGKAAGDLNAGLQAVVSGGGLKLASGAVSAGQVKQALAGNTSAVALAATGAGAGYVLVGRVDVKYAGSEMGQYFAFAAGQVKVVDTVCGRTVLQLTLPRTKGGHISRRQACDKAASNALSALTARLTAWMQRR